MNANKGRVWLIVSIALIVAGISLMLVSGIRNGEALEQNLYEHGAIVRAEEKTYTITEPFRSVTVSDASADVKICPSDDGTCRVVCGESDTRSYHVRVEDGVLKVLLQEDKGTSSFILHYETPPVRVYLPEAQYKTLQVETSSGSIDVQSGPSWDQAKLKSTSGEIRVQDTETGDLELSSSSGDVYLFQLRTNGVRIDTVSGEVELYACNCGDLSVTSSSGDQRLSELQAGKTQLQAVSGEIRLSAATLRELRIETSSGDVHLEAAVSRGHAQIRTVSGEVHLQDADAATMEIRTSSGNVRGSIRTEKDFRVETSSGDVYTSGSRRGAGECYVVTSSGDVHLTAGG